MFSNTMEGSLAFATMTLEAKLYHLTIDDLERKLTSSRRLHLPLLLLPSELEFVSLLLPLVLGFKLGKLGC